MATNCTTNNCNREIYNKTRQLCQPCNQRFLRKNAPPATQDVLADRLWPSIRITDPDKCWEWQGATVDGYGRFSLHSKPYSSHRAAFFVHNGYWTTAMTLHKCGNRKCCNPHHLYEGNHKENAGDRKGHGRQGEGEKIWNAKLTDNKVIVIKNLLRDGVKVKQLSILCDVSEKSINQIKDGVSWKHIY